MILGLTTVGSDAKSRLSRGRRRLRKGLGKNGEIRAAIREWERLERRYSQDYTPRRFQRRRGDLPAFGSGKVETPRGVVDILHSTFDSILPPWRWSLSTDHWDNHRQHYRHTTPRRRAPRGIRRRRKQPVQATPPGTSIDSDRFESPLRPPGGAGGDVATTPAGPRTLEQPKRRRRLAPLSSSSSSSGSYGSWMGDSLDSSECRGQLAPRASNGGTLPRGRRGPGWRGVALLTTTAVSLASLLLLI